jgi:energy-coupling factor transport system ATP-binding protein
MGLSRPELRERVRWAMDLVGLDFEHYVDRLTSTLSGGERRRVGLAGGPGLRSGGGTGRTARTHA